MQGGVLIRRVINWKKIMQKWCRQNKGNAKHLQMVARLRAAISSWPDSNNNNNRAFKYELLSSELNIQSKWKQIDTISSTKAQIFICTQYVTVLYHGFIGNNYNFQLRMNSRKILPLILFHVLEIVWCRFCKLIFCFASLSILTGRGKC